MPSAKLIQKVRAVLTTLESSLKRDYAKGYLFMEGDIQLAVGRHLYDALSEIDDRWFVAAEHTIRQWKPDIVCYFFPDRFRRFLPHYEDYVVAIIEIKYWLSPLPDLRKLAKIQKSKGCLVWSVFANHFDRSIHRQNAEKAAGYESAVKKWVARSPGNRGATILRCGHIRPVGQFSRYKERINAYRNDFWVHD